MEDFNNLFDLDDSSFTESANRPKRKRQVDLDLYAPKASDGKNDVYKSIIRPVPYLKDKSLSKYTKYSAKLVNPITKEWLYLDCPSTAGQSSILLSTEIAIKTLRKQGEETIANEIAENFNRWHNHFSPVYIKKDPQNPDLDGTIKIFKYGHQINQVIINEMPKKEGEEEDELGIETEEKINPFHLLKGKDLIYVAKKKNQNWSDYTETKFIDQRSPLIYTIGDKEIHVSKDEKVMQLTAKFLSENTPDMDKYLFKPWTDEDYAKCLDFLKAIIPYKNILDNIVQKTRDPKIQALYAGSTETESNDSPVEENLEFETPNSETNEDPLADEITAKAETSTETEVEKTESSDSTGSGGATQEEIDDLLNDL